MHCALEFDVQGRKRLETTVRFETHVQKTSHVFPSKGNGMITQGGAWNDGHRNWTRANALPHAYANGPLDRHDRGTISSAG